MPRGNGGRAGANTQKKQKSPSKKHKGHETRREKRAERASELTFEKFMKGERRDLTLGFVLDACGNGRFKVRLISGETTECITIGGNLSVGKKKGFNPSVKVAIFPSTKDRNGRISTPGSDVLTDGSVIYAVLDREETRQALRRLGERSRSPAKKLSAVSEGSERSESAGAASPLNGYIPGEAPEGFAWNVPNYKPKERAARLATRKAEHKAEKRARRAAKVAEREAVVADKYANLKRVEAALEAGRPGNVGLGLKELKIPRERVSRWGFGQGGV